MKPQVDLRRETNEVRAKNAPILLRMSEREVSHSACSPFLSHAPFDSLREALRRNFVRTEPFQYRFHAENVING